jgi:hypothetical protein
MADPAKRIAARLVGRMRTALWRFQAPTFGEVEAALGCSWAELVQAIERRFEPGMTWANYGRGPGKWCLDHAVPLSSASTREGKLALCRHDNLVPRWVTDNARKGSSQEWQQ